VRIRARLALDFPFAALLLEDVGHLHRRVIRRQILHAETLRQPRLVVVERHVDDIDRHLIEIQPMVALFFWKYATTPSLTASLFWMFGEQPMSRAQKPRDDSESNLG